MRAENTKKKRRALMRATSANEVLSRKKTED